MKKIALALYVAALASASMAAQAGQVGKITFVGQIVDSPCSTTGNGDVICYRNGKEHVNNKELQEQLYSEKLIKIDEKRAVRVLSYN